MSAGNKRSSNTSLILFTLFFPFFAVYGVLVGVRFVLRALGRARGAQLALAKELRCPTCRRLNATTGRFRCGVCHATYHGWVGKCGLCGAGAGWFECERCGVSIRLPWEGT